MTMNKKISYSIIAVLALFVIYLTYETNKESIDKFVTTNFSLLVSSLIGGVLASVLGSIIFYLLLGRSEHLKTLSSETQRLLRKYDALVERLPDAIGGEFTRSLFQYNPAMSPEIASTLSNHVKNVYNRHSDRVCVKNNEENYVLNGLREVDLGGKKLMVWDLDFHVTWEWHNDSEEEKYPFRNFKIAITCPDTAITTFLQQGLPLKDRLQKIAVFNDNRVNWIRSIIVHPDDASLKVPQDSVSKFIQIIKVKAKMENETLFDREVDQLEVIQESEDDIGIYRAYSLNSEDKKLGLQRDKSISMEYEGKLTLPFQEDKDSYFGILSFSPSDVISEGYRCQLQYPRTVNYNGGVLNLKINSLTSGCSNLNDPLQRTEVVIGTPPDSAPPPRDHQIAYIKPSGPITDFHRIQIVWYEDKPKPNSKGESGQESQTACSEIS